MNKKFFVYSGCAMIVCMLGLMPVAFAQNALGNKALTGPKPAAEKIEVKPQKEAEKTVKSFSIDESGATMYEQSKQRRAQITKIVDGYEKNGENLEDGNVVKKIYDDVSKLMLLIPSKSLTLRSPKDLSDAANKKMETMYGKEDFSKTLQAEAEAKYPMVNLREKVTVEYVKGPKHFRVSGILYRVTPFAVTINDSIIDFVDLGDEERAKFDKAWNKQLREQYVETNRQRLVRKRAEEAQTIYDQLKFALFKKNESAGFIYLAESDNWTNAREVTRIYIETVLKRKAAEKEAADKTAAQKAQQKAQDGENQNDENAGKPGRKEHAAENAENADEAERADSDSNKVTIEDNEENRAQYEEVKEKINAGMEELAEASGIDAVPAYKSALWGFDISEVRFALWKEKEFKNMRAELGRDTISGEGIDLKEGGLKIASVDLVYDSNALSKVVYSFKNTSRTDFQDFKNGLTEQFGQIKEDKNGDYLKSIFTGKQGSIVAAGEDELNEMREGLEKAKSQMDELQTAFDEADDETKEAAEAALKKAQNAVKSLEKKVQSAENATVGKEYEYISSRMKFKKNEKGSAILPYIITWKGEKTSGTVFFYYDKQSDRVENIYFLKEVN